MKVVVDSGSTKADWVFLDSDQGTPYHTMGFNPVFHSSETITEEVEKTFKHQVDTDAEMDIYFYGAGCWDAKRKTVIKEGLERVFTNAQIHVWHDLLGAARATCGHDAGISCIIGTGSNSCLYDGTDVIDNVTNLGYMLGDEGSGTHLGKKLIRHYFYREMPKELLESFEEFVQGGKDEILDRVYGSKDTPNVYLASFTRFMSAHMEHPFIHRILYRSFAEFIDRHVRKYKGHSELPIHFIGSIAYIFQDVLKLILTERAMEAGIFIKAPIENMVKFHQGTL
ncbi:MAG: hypothetical protein KDC54_13350 [Lewinella sp.]|nr:hypothetical protein [Lewinella sp.]